MLKDWYIVLITSGPVVIYRGDFLALSYGDGIMLYFDSSLPSTFAL